ncbi:hypothetical protein R6U77_05260 [Lysinibacillus louembei]|uniref:Uncharacterized protein n=1 Tax=Lysinibacillus louembei TaxID=1470088 RepID=A0ABZ0S5B0_9BACI|nr:hypothetical protein [Lysinibacillus louembei]WPK13097.1 hypothetical protein R6U77_05260 [Lysinibacillus louembei]
MKKLYMTIAVVILCFVFMGAKASAAGVQAYGDVLYEIVTKPNGKKEVIIVGKNAHQKTSSFQLLLKVILLPKLLVVHFIHQRLITGMK